MTRFFIRKVPKRRLWRVYDKDKILSVHRSRTAAEEKLTTLERLRKKKRSENIFSHSGFKNIQRRAFLGKMLKGLGQFFKDVLPDNIDPQAEDYFDVEMLADQAKKLLEPSMKKLRQKFELQNKKIEAAVEAIIHPSKPQDIQVEDVLATILVAITDLDSPGDISDGQEILKETSIKTQIALAAETLKEYKGIGSKASKVLEIPEFVKITKKYIDLIKTPDTDLESVVKATAAQLNKKRGSALEELPQDELMNVVDSVTTLFTHTTPEEIVNGGLKPLAMLVEGTILYWLEISSNAIEKTMPYADDSEKKDYIRALDRKQRSLLQQYQRVIQNEILKAESALGSQEPEDADLEDQP